MIKLCGLYFLYFLYADELKREVKFTLKDLKHKITVISLKNINLDDFGD